MGFLLDLPMENGDLMGLFMGFIYEKWRFYGISPAKLVMLVRFLRKINGDFPWDLNNKTGDLRGFKQHKR